MTKPLHAFFPLGRIVATPGALLALGVEGIGPDALLQRHVTCDWGELCEEDGRENEVSMKEGFRILSAYVLPRSRIEIWVITEADRTATTLLLPDEY